MRTVRMQNPCKKDIKLAQKRGKNLEKLWVIVDLLIADQPLEPRHRLHRLSGNWSGFYECHIEPDWLLIFFYAGDALVLVRTGTHSDLFD